MIWAIVFLMELTTIVMMAWWIHIDVHFDSMQYHLDKLSDQTSADIHEWFKTHDDDRDGELQRLLDSRWRAYFMFKESR